MQDKTQLRTQVADRIIVEMFQVKKGEIVAITLDKGTNTEIAHALADATSAVGGLPLIMWIPLGRADGQEGMPDWPAKPLTAALCEVDVWIEMNSIILLYSDIWETALSKNKKLRYLIIGDSTIESLSRVFTGFDVPLLDKLLHKVMAMTKKTSKIRITSKNGTDVFYETNPEYSFDLDAGDFSKPKFCTAPGYVNIVPKTGSMNGKIVFDMLMHTNSSNGPIAFNMKDGSIVAVEGGKEADKFSAYLSAFDDPNMYKISHHMISLNPNIRELSGEVVEDERIWGGVDFGFGHTSPIDMPPYGQVAKSHFDGVVAKATIYLDDQKIVDDGTVCHPDLIDLANQLLS